jgi:uncharacterized protein (TIGR02145 family)
MKIFFVSLFIFFISSIFAQNELREAIDRGDYATAQKMVRNGDAEEIYCGAMPAKNAVDVYGKIFKSAPEAAFEACPSQFSFGYASRICADGKQSTLCLNTLQFLEKEGENGNFAGIESFSAAVKVALKNKAYLKPSSVKIDTLVWETCSKQERKTCFDSCMEWVRLRLNDVSLDSLARLQVENQKIQCEAKPAKQLAKQITVKRNSAFQTELARIALEGYWKSPLHISPAWLNVLTEIHRNKGLADTALPDLHYVKAWALKHAAAHTPVPGGELFRFCAAWGDSVNAVLDSVGIMSRCPVFGKLTDPRDGKIYKIKEIAGKTWMVQNLNFEMAGSECYDRDLDKCKTYGRLYTWNAAQSACPAGWHLSTDADWALLEEEAGGASDAASKLRSNGSDDYAFSVTFGGYFNQNTIFTTVGEGAYFWTELQDDEARSFARSLLSDGESVDRISVNKTFGLSVRCVRD